MKNKIMKVRDRTKTMVFVTAVFMLGAGLTGYAQQDKPLLSVQEIMTGIVEPGTNVIWGAQEAPTVTQWRLLQNAAISIIASGELLAQGGAGENDNKWAGEADWQRYNKEMVSAARGAVMAIERKDIEALLEIGNDRLYPPCENCHRQYMKR